MEDRNSTCKVSVILPHYNQSHLIPNAINSIRNQTCTDWELIIVDDGSERKHLDVLFKLLGKIDDRRIIFCPLEHRGLVSARNYGNAVARGDIIAVQDADDLSLPDRLEKCLLRIEEGVEVVCHDAYTNFWDKELNCITRGYIKNPPFQKELLLKNQCYTAWPVYKKSVWQSKPFRLETGFAYDWTMWLDWAYSGFKIFSYGVALYEYVRHENSASIVFERDGRRQKSVEEIARIMKEEYGESLQKTLFQHSDAGV